MSIPNELAAYLTLNSSSFISFEIDKRTFDIPLTYPYPYTLSEVDCRGKDIIIQPRRYFASLDEIFAFLLEVIQ